jgi:hypothetical protein
MLSPFGFSFDRLRTGLWLISAKHRVLQSERCSLPGTRFFVAEFILSLSKGSSE